MSVIIHIPVPDHLLPTLERKAGDLGLEIGQYISNLVSRDLNGQPTVDEVLAEFRKQVARTGILDPDLDQLLESARREVSIGG